MSRHKFNGSILGDTDMSTTANSKALRLEMVENVSLQVAFTGTASGSFKVQTSDDDGGPEPSSPTITNWTDENGSTVSIAGGAGSPVRWNISGAGARWVRIVWTRTGSTGTWTSARATLKGAG